MATNINTTQITPPRVPIIDDRTGAVSREWYRWFFNLYTITGSGLGITPVINGGTGLGDIPSNGQLLIGNGTGYTLNTLGTSVGISVVNSAGNITLANTGVLSNIAGSGITVSGATGNVTITNAGVLSWSGGTTGLTPAAATTGDIVLAGTLGITNGGTNGSAAPTAGAVPYGTGTAYGFTAAGSAGQVLTSNGAGVPTWTTPTTGTITSVSFTGGIVSVATPTTTPALTVAGTSGGVVYFSSGTTWASSGALTQYGVIYGGGAGASPVATAAGTTGQVLTATTGGAPTWAAPATSGTVTNVSALTLGTTGTDLSSTVANGTTTPVITLQVPTASAANRGALSAADWTTFNSKAPGVTFTTNYIPYGQGTTTLNQSISLQFDGTNLYSAGRLLTGSSTAVTPGSGVQIPKVQSLATSAQGSVLATHYGNNANASAFYLLKSRSGVVGTQGTTVNGDALGQLQWLGSDGTNYINSATVEAYVANTVSTGVVPSYLLFRTTNSAGTQSERVRIDASGYVGINNTAPATYLDIVGGVGTVTSPTFLNQTMAVLRNNFHARMAFVNPSNTYSGEISRYNASAAFPTHTFSLNGAGNFIFTSGDGTVATTEKMRITSAGDVGIGTTTMNGKFNSTPKATYNATSTTWAESALSTSGTYSGGLSMIDGTAGYGLNVEDSGTSFLIRQGTVGSSPASRFRIGSTGVLVTYAVGLGYDTGAGGTVTQGTSRGTAVTINKPTGAITMFTAAGSLTWSQFTVNNSLVAATDTIIINQKAGAVNYYVYQILAVTAGSFNIGFASVSGVASDGPVLSFTIIKGATS